MPGTNGQCWSGREVALVGLAGLLVLAATGLAQDTVTRRYGDPLTGQVLLINRDSLVFVTTEGMKTQIPLDDVVSLSSPEQEVMEKFHDLRGRFAGGGGDPERIGPVLRRDRGQAELDPASVPDEPPDAPTAAAIEDLAAQLGSSPQAEDALVETYGRQATRAILRRLDDPADYRRRAACRVLGRIRDARAIDELIRRLNDLDGKVRAEAARALVPWVETHPKVREAFLTRAPEEGLSEVIRVLLLPLAQGPMDLRLKDRLQIDILRARSSTRIYYYVALAFLRDQETAEYLRSWLQASRPDDVLVARALASVDAEPALSYLIDALRTAGADADRRRELLDALEEVTGEYYGHREATDARGLEQASARYQDWWENQQFESSSSPGDH